MDITGMEMDPKADEGVPVIYNTLRFYYREGDTDPELIWISTSYDRVGRLFDGRNISLNYNWSGQSIINGLAVIRINLEYVQLIYQNNEWLVPEEARALLNVNGLMEQRLAWLDDYRPRPLTLRKTVQLSIYDLFDSVAQLSGHL